MTRLRLDIRIGLWLMFATGGLHSATVMGEQVNDLNGSSVQSALHGTWYGELHSKHDGTAPSTLTMEVNSDANGHAVATAMIGSGCLAGSELKLEVATEGETVTFAGSDIEGNSLTLRGALDKTGAILTSNATINGSATGRCELDTGTGTLVKQ